MRTIEIKFFWSTYEGSEWLSKSETFPECININNQLELYELETKEQAARLVEGWRREGDAQAHLFADYEVDPL